MPKKISIAIDAMGGDNSPDKTLEGIKIFIKKNKSFNDFELNIFGKEEIIKEKLDKLNINSMKIFPIKNNFKFTKTHIKI